MRPREVLDDLQSDGALLSAAEEEVPRDGSGHDGSGQSKRHGSCDHLRMQLSRVSEWVNEVATTIITTTHMQLMLRQIRDPTSTRRDKR
jgi:hypothetical protein